MLWINDLNTQMSARENGSPWVPTTSDNRVIIGLIKRFQLRDELLGASTKRVRTDKLFTIGRMASPPQALQDQRSV